MATLKNHPGFWLRDDAAAAFDAAEDGHGPFSVNSAGRTPAYQQNLISRWDRGGPENRPPFLFPPARPATLSNHVRDGGIAVDVADWSRFREVCEQFGFRWYGEKDPVHFDYIGRPTTATTPTTPDTNQEDPMIIFIKGRAGRRRGGIYFIQNGKATFLGAHAGKNVPAITDEGEIAALQKRVSGIG